MTIPTNPETVLNDPPEAEVPPEEDELWQGRRVVAQATTEGEDDDEMHQKWKASPFAVGLTHATWREERNAEFSHPSHIRCSAFCCSCLPVGRVGNMVVLHQTNESVVDANGLEKSCLGPE